MKYLILLLTLATFSHRVLAQSNIPSIEIDIEEQIDASIEDDFSEEVISGEKNLIQSIKEKFDIEGGVVIFPMFLEGNIAVETEVIEGLLNVGVETGTGFVFAGTSGAMTFKVGAYGEVVVKRNENGTYKVKVGRYYNIMNSSNGLRDYSSFEMGLIRETNSGESFGLTLKEFKTPEGDSLYLPLVTFTKRF